MEYFASIVDLQPFMNKKFFNYFIYYLPKNINIKNYQVYNQLNFPYVCYLEFDDKKEKQKFYEQYNNKLFPGLTCKIVINMNPDPIDSLNLCSNMPEDKLVIYKCNYEQMAETYFEKNFTDEGLIYLDQEVIDKQRDSIGYFVKKIGSQLFKGESVMNISLPVSMFDERSLSETISLEQSYAPIFLNRAYLSAEKIERLKWVATYALANLHLSVIQTKPFTPILGETTQIKIGDMDFYVENTISKPPTLNFYGIAKNYKIYGSAALYAETGANSVTAKKKGSFIIEFIDVINGEKVKDLYQYYSPTIQINGVLIGKRTLNYTTPLVVKSLNNNMGVFIKFNPDKRGAVASLLGLSQKTFPDFANGYIVPSDLIIIDHKTLEHKCKPKEKHILCNLDSEWTNYLRFDKTKYWSKEEYKVPISIKSECKIASDSSFRKDIIAFKINDQNESQKWKEEYEKIQRDDRVLRKKRSD